MKKLGHFQDPLLDRQIEEITRKPEDWHTPTLLNGWVDYGLGFSPTGFYKDPLGRVHLRGVIKSGTTAALTVLFTLPEGYRPAYLHYGNGRINAGPVLIFVRANGQVGLGTTGDVNFTCLDSISFRAEQ